MNRVLPWRLRLVMRAALSAALALSAWCVAPVASVRAQDDLDLGLGDEDEGDAAEVLESTEAEAAEEAPDVGDADADVLESTDGEGEAEAEVDVAESEDAAADTDAELEDLVAPEPAAGPASGERALKLRTAAGLGFGTLAYERPVGPGMEVLSEAPFGAAEILIGVHVAPASTLSLDVQLAYQTSFGLALELEPLYALPERVNARYQHGALTVAPVLRLSSAPRALAVALPIGFGMQLFEPTLHQYTLARYSVGGPQLGLELRLPLGEVVSLRLGPEAQWIALINPSLSDAGACCNGFAVGGQGAIEARVGSFFLASLAYREAHAFAPAGAYRFKSIERFLTARIAGEL